MIIIKNGYNNEIVECSNCKSILLIDKDELTEYNEIEKCPCCQKNG